MKWIKPLLQMMLFVGLLSLVAFLYLRDFEMPEKKEGKVFMTCPTTANDLGYSTLNFFVDDIDEQNFSRFVESGCRWYIE